MDCINQMATEKLAQSQRWSRSWGTRLLWWRVGRSGLYCISEQMIYEIWSIDDINIWRRNRSSLTRMVSRLTRDTHGMTWVWSEASTRSRILTLLRRTDYFPCSFSVCACWQTVNVYRQTCQNPNTCRRILYFECGTKTQLEDTSKHIFKKRIFIWAKEGWSDRRTEKAA
jgi:hypothetical protein